jgi:transcriptional regulator with XRE-family HTH domain
MGEKIRQFRKRKNLTQAELARRLGVDRSTINKIENGKIRPSLALLERIAHELGVSVKDFF